MAVLLNYRDNPAFSLPTETFSYILGEFTITIRNSYTGVGYSKWVIGPMYSSNEVDQNSESECRKVFTYRPDLNVVANKSDQGVKRPLFALVLTSFLCASAIAIVLSLILLGKIFINDGERAFVSETASGAMSDTTVATSNTNVQVLAPSIKALQHTSATHNSIGKVLSLSESSNSETSTNDPSIQEEDLSHLESFLRSEVARYTSKLFNSSVEPFQFADMLREASAQRKQDPLLVTALIATISSFNPVYKTKGGESGIFGLTESKALNISKLSGIEWKGAEELNNPAYSLLLGVSYLQYLDEHYKFTLRQTLLAFHWDPDLVMQAIAENKFAPDGSREFASTVQQKLESLKRSKEKQAQ